MIPVSLKLSNFTSYGESVPEFDFTKFHMAVISGSNGVGKSSLLDAITWCVWGWARAGDSADDLIRLGASDMSVEFSFELDRHIYTVKRRRSKKAGGSTSLELWSGSTSPSILKSSGLKGSPSHNLTEGTIKATQQKIIDTLHLSYETFTNSSFLRQGHADEFTTRGPTERKRILADILGLNHYDLLEEKAKEKIKEVQSKLTLLDYQLLEIEAELSQKEQREKAFTLAQKEAEEIEKQLKEIEELIKSIEGEKQALSITIKSLDDKKKQTAAAKNELTDLKIQIEVKEKAQQEFSRLLAQKEEIENKNQQKQKLEDRKKELEVKRSELLKLKDEREQIEKTLRQREQKRDLEVSKLEVEVKKYQTENEGLEKQITHLKDHADTCPTCGQNIGKEKNKQIFAENQKKISENNKVVEQLQAKKQKYTSYEFPEKIKSQQLGLQLKNLAEQTTFWDKITSQITQLENYAESYLKLQQAEIVIKTHLEAIEDLQKIYSLKQKQIAESEKELEDLLKYEALLKEIEEKLSAKLLVKEELSQKVLQLRGTVGEAKQLVSRSKQMEDLFDKKSKEKKEYQKQKEAFEELALAFGKKGIQAMIIETAIPEIEDEANKLLYRLTEGRMKVRFETQRETKTLRLRASTHSINTQGRTELNRSTTELSRMSSGQAGLEKAPGIVETLDIIISDEMGERNYELYSGGEAFRINFAIRIALSKLLTRRAGAKLQFLIIDEGFGTQDAQGRTRIVEVLDAIKDDFEKIVIITHLDELKEEFPTRIEVSKNSHGSTFEVVGV